MIIYDGTFRWDGFGGRLKLASGECLLRIIDLRKKEPPTDITYVKPIIVVVSDRPGSPMSVKSCAGNIATLVTQDFNISPARMTYIEYYKEVDYGKEPVRTIPEEFETVKFEWHQGKAIKPTWRPTDPSMITTVKNILKYSL